MFIFSVYVSSSILVTSNLFYVQCVVLCRSPSRTQRLSSGEQLFLIGGQNHLNRTFNNKKKKFPPDWQTSWEKSLSQPVNFPGAHPIMKSL